jgi:hypothetical protein
VKVVLAAGIALALLVPQVALANGDPASHVLPSQDVFYPGSPSTVSGSLTRQLNGLMTESQRKGYALKVALIASPDDLGTVPELFGKPEEYAQLLDEEIAFNSKPRLLVVMPAGFGLATVSGRERRAIRRISIPDDASADDLARAAVLAVPKLATAAGHPVKAVKPVGGSGGSRGSSGASVLLIVTPFLVFGVVLAYVSLRGRNHE